MKKEKYYMIDLETKIYDAWQVTDFIKLVTNDLLDNPKYSDLPASYADDIMNRYMGIADLYELRFEKLQEAYHEAMTQYYWMEQKLRDDNIDDIREELLKENKTYE